MDYSTPGLPNHHRPQELAQTHVHQGSDAIQPSYTLSTPSPPALNLSQHQGVFLKSQFFTSGGQSIGASASASVLPMNIQGWFPLRLTGLILQSKGLSRVFSKPQFKSTNSSAFSFLYSPTLDKRGGKKPKHFPSHQIISMSRVF